MRNFPISGGDDLGRKKYEVPEGGEVMYYGFGGLLLIVLIVILVLLLL